MIKGKESIFFIKYQDDWAPISCETESPMSEDVEVIGTTTRDNYGWKSYLAMEQGYSITVSGQAKKEDDSGILSYFRLKEIKRSREVIEWKRETLQGFYLESGTGIITNISDGNETNEIMTFNMTILGNGRPLGHLDLVKHDQEGLVEWTDGDNFVKYD